MIIAGTLESGGYSYYCAVNNTIYAAESVVKSLDITFKIIFALDLKYQLECHHIWSCIQKILYAINNPEEKFSISTDTVICKIKDKWNKI